jgi:polysaccharide biosynthesis protein VpsJ
MQAGAAPPAGSEPEGHAGPGAETDAMWAREAARAIWTRLAAQDYAGWDPYDALNARLLPAAVKTSRLTRRIVTQAVKRSPLPLQPLLGVKREADAYTLGHVLLTAARLSTDSGPSNVVAAPAGARAARATPDVASTCERVLARLRSMANFDGERMAWGYHFPVHTRFFSYVPPTPNLIVTAFVAKGMAAVTRAGLADCTPEIRGAVAFVLGGLPRVTDETGQCIGYVPDDSTVVHNANMLAALVLCEAAEIVGAPADPGGAASGGAPPSDDTAAWIDAALACARYTVARQAADGSWPYSEESYGRWVDGFHTGFVLEGLSRVVRATGEAELSAALQRGLRYYVAQLFGPEGEPKYYPAHAHPFDALSAAQGVETLHVAIGGQAAQAVPGQLEWIRQHLVTPDGRVAYQVRKRWTDRREFPRWSSAPLMSALAGVAPHAEAGAS